jgi:thiol:disulfide interchange protein DsbD
VRLASLLIVLASAALAQQDGALSVDDPAKLGVKRAGVTDLRLKVHVREGFHVNSNTPSEDYLIPLKVTWEPGAVEAVETVYPKPKHEQYAFSDKPLSVFDGTFEIVTKFKPGTNSAPGPGVVNGKLRYQACNDKMCLPPKNIAIKLPVVVE